MDEQIKTYYKYQYTLGENSVHIQGFEDWEEYTINFVDVNINRLGVSEFFMYSDSADAKDIFMEGISEILSNDMNATHRAYELSSGRFHQFNKFWREQDEKLESLSPATPTREHGELTDPFGDGSLLFGG